MKYNFDEITDRFNTNSLKWDYDIKENELPMWVADMDFKVAPCIIRAVTEKAQKGVYGYGIVPNEWYNAVISWWDRKHDFRMNKEWLIFSTGVVPAITSIVKRMTNVGDNVVIMTPSYDIFFHSVENTGRHVLECELDYVENKYEINYNDLELKLSDPLTTLMILCNPHNPIGKVWTKYELEKIGRMCKKYGVVVLSDEIHCDITPEEVRYTPFASVSEDNKNNSITCLSAGKSFNLAGMQSAIVSVPDEIIRNKINRCLNSDEVAEPNTFAIESVISAFNEGEEWLEELKKYIQKNISYAVDFIEKKLPILKVVKQNATYLLWVDCSAVAEDTELLCDFIRQKTGLYITAGGQYRGNGSKFVRINLATQMERVKDGMNRFYNGIQKFVLNE